MRVLATAIAIAALAAFPAAAKLDSSNSVVTDSVLADRLFFDGTGCGSTVSQTVPLPSGATDVNVVKPKAGATNGAARISAVAVEAGLVRFTAIGDSAATCAPGEEGDAPPAERRWAGDFDYEIRLSRRVQVVQWVLNDEGSSRRIAIRPRKIHIRFLSTLVGIRWKSFGGKKAVRSGRLVVHLLNNKRCKPRMCPGNGQRFRVELTRPRVCGDLPDGTVYYSRVSFITTRRVGVIPPNRLFQREEPYCSAGPRPAR